MIKMGNVHKQTGNNTIVILSIVLVLLIALLYGVDVRKKLLQARIIETRIADVEALKVSYINLLNANRLPTMEDLMLDLRLRGFNLKNPIPKDTNKPSYRIVAPTNEYGFNSSPDTVIVEETDNVKDAKNRVRGRAFYTSLERR